MQLGSTLNHGHPHQTIYEYDRRVMMMMMGPTMDSSSDPHWLVSVSLSVSLWAFSFSCLIH